MAGMAVDLDDVREILRLYPQIYVACHVDHVRATSTRWQLSAHDSAILAHLHPRVPVGPRDLAKHLGVKPSTLSASIARLESLGYLTNTAPARDKRRRELRLTERGVEAMASTSVLDRELVTKLLATLTVRERADAVRGLGLLARGARALRTPEGT